MMLQHIECFTVSAVEWKKSRGGGGGSGTREGGGGLEEFVFHKDWPFSLRPSVFSWWKAPLLVSWHSFACLCAWGTFNLASDTRWSVTLPNKWGFVQTKRLPDRSCKVGAWYPAGKAGYGWAGTGNSLRNAAEPRRSHPVHTRAFRPSQSSSPLCGPSVMAAWSAAAFGPGDPSPLQAKLTLNDGTYSYGFFISQSTFTIINSFATITS